MLWKLPLVKGNKLDLSPLDFLLTNFRELFQLSDSRQQQQQPTNQPTNQPANQPTNQPTSQPASQPANQPTNQPTNQNIPRHFHFLSIIRFYWYWYNTHIAGSRQKLHLTWGWLLGLRETSYDIFKGQDVASNSVKGSLHKKAQRKTFSCIILFEEDFSQNQMCIQLR